MQTPIVGRLEYSQDDISVGGYFVPSFSLPTTGFVSTIPLVCVRHLQCGCSVDGERGCRLRWRDQMSWVNSSEQIGNSAELQEEKREDLGVLEAPRGTIQTASIPQTD